MKWILCMNVEVMNVVRLFIIFLLSVSILLLWVKLLFVKKLYNLVVCFKDLLVLFVGMIERIGLKLVCFNWNMIFFVYSGVMLVLVIIVIF